MPQDSVGQLGTGTDQMLAVVEHDQNMLEGKGIEQGLENRPARLPSNAQCPGNGRRDRIPV